MRKLLVLVLILAGFQSFAQQDALFSQYMFNMLVLNPAYAGTNDVLSVTAVGRKQWVIDGGPRTLTFTVHSPLRNKRVGLGLYCYTDVLGPQQTSGVVTNYSYNVSVGKKGKLSLGLQAGILHSNIDWLKVDMPDPNDVAYMGDQTKKLIPDINFGVYYYTDKFYAGISSKHLLEQEFSIAEVGQSSVYGNLLRHFYGMVGVAIPITDNLVLKPSTLIKYVRNAPLQVDLNASLLINEVLWLGVSYRTERTAVFLAELVVGQRLRIGYSYDVFLNELSVYNKGSHEVMLGYDLPLFQRRMITPRYF